MLKQFCPCLRNDLIITVKINSQNKTKIYSIQKPDSSENFEFGEEEFFLCQSLDGRSTSDEIIDNFKEEFNVSISADDFENFITQIKQFGLLDNFLSQEERQLANNHHLAEQDDEDDDDFISQSQNNYVPRWSILKNPEPIFESIVSILKPLLILYKLVLWGLLVQKSLQNGQQLGSFLTFFLISLLLINLVTKVGRGIFATYYGASVKELGMLIRWGFVPRFYTKIIGINRLNKKQQLLIYSSPLFFRGTLFILGTFLWYFNLGQGNLLSSIAILLAIIGLASLISGALPLRPASPGARILALSMNKSANYPRQLMKSSLISLFNSKNNPKRISKKEILIICLGLIITIILCFIVLKISLRFAWGLSLSFPAIFGQGTFYIILSLLLLLGFNYIRKIFIHASDSAPSLLKRETLSNNFDSSYDVDFSLQKKNNGRNLMIILLILIILMIPIPYSIGGDCQLLPPKQQEIQAPVSGKIERIFYDFNRTNQRTRSRKRAISS